MTTTFNVFVNKIPHENNEILNTDINNEILELESYKEVMEISKNIEDFMNGDYISPRNIHKSNNEIIYDEFGNKIKLILFQFMIMKVI